MTPQHRPVQTTGRVLGAADLTRERLADHRVTASGELSSASLPRDVGASDPSDVTSCDSSGTAMLGGPCLRTVAIGAPVILAWPRSQRGGPSGAAWLFRAFTACSSVTAAVRAASLVVRSAAA